MTVVQRIREPNDQFPVGMRVLAVDDDSTCLLLLGSLLRRCNYHVTTTSQATQALRMLRENKDRFDLVISDVHMPDMDGFSLLEQVGIEMDLPVIMLSANGDTELVMKGVTHGACDYLVKPVRLEELKNIWQHVVRKKKVEPQDRTNCNNQQKRPGVGCEGQASSGMGNLDQDGKSGKRRKDQFEEEHESNDENEHDNEDSSAQKKPRVVWSVELHRKFVAAVDQLGFEKAVPKKILELMNVDKLTRENVASHLQKYRLYLKRISNVANQQANMVAALGAADPSYLRMNAINFNHHYNSSGQVPNNALRPLPPAGMLGRLNSSAGLGIHGLSPPGTAPLGHGQIGRNAVTMTDYKFQSLWLGGEQNGNILQGLPTSLELPGTSDNSRMYPLSTGFSDAKGADTNLGGSGNSLVGLLDSSLLYQGHAQESQSRGPLGSQPSPGASDSFRCNGNWPNGVQAASFPSRSNYQSGDIMHTTSGLGGGSGEMNSVLGNAQMSVTTTGPSCVTQSQPALLGGSMSFGGYGSKGVWDDNRGLDALQHSDYSSSFSVAQGACPSLPGGSGMANGNAGFGLTGMADYDPLGAAASSQQHGAENSAPSGYTAGNAGSLEDVVTAMIKREPESSALKGW